MLILSTDSSLFYTFSMKLNDALYFNLLTYSLVIYAHLKHSTTSNFLILLRLAQLPLGLKWQKHV